MRRRKSGWMIVALTALGGCAHEAPHSPLTASAESSAASSAAATGGSTERTADAFVARITRELSALQRERMAAAWTAETDITPDTELLTARAEDRLLAYFSNAVDESKRFEGQPMSVASARQIALLRLGVGADVDQPSPRDPAARDELTRLLAQLDAMYGAGKFCAPADRRTGNVACRTLDDLSKVLADGRDFDALTEAWREWHTISRPMRPMYARFVELANGGARELGFSDLGVMWRSRYDMTPAEFEGEIDRLWAEVKPLYDQLHCYARSRLAQRYGAARVPPGQPIPAQLLGNMWAQSWQNLYEDILKPFPQVAGETADQGLVAAHWDALGMTRSAESFYTSLGFPPLPASFWQRSMLTRPRDREVVCHASAWDMDGGHDVRVKACLEPTAENLFTIYHELGHDYYFMAYAAQPFLFRAGANDGFHEAIGDTVNLSVTPGYLHQIGLVRAAAPSREAVINEQLRLASDKIAFLPFGLVVDRWRWQVFSGAVSPAHYNQAWWTLRRRYQGVSEPLPRTEADFDPGAKYHVPSNTPYARYFLAQVLQFQFHRALCHAAGFAGPLHECSVFGSAAAGERLRAMLALGASAPWPEALAQLTGSRQLDASAILEYFAPLAAWLEEQNRDTRCGWTP